MKASDIAAHIGGRLVGDGDCPLEAVAPLDRAGPTDLSFLSVGRYVGAFHASRAGAVLMTSEHETLTPGPLTRIVVDDAYRAMLASVALLYPAARRPSGVDATARVGRGAVLGADVALGPFVVIGAGAAVGDRTVIGAHAVVGDGVRIGDDVTVHPQVVLYPGTTVGHRVILHAGVRLGVDGFGYVSSAAGHQRLPHVGRCIIGDDVEIGANSTIDRGSVDDTVIGPGTKIDNLVHIAHNCRIGARCLLMAHVGLAGSTRLEDDVILAGQSGVAGHLTIGAKARLGARAGVIGDVAAGTTVSGFPARPHRDFMRATSALYRLADIIIDLEKLVERERDRG